MSEIRRNLLQSAKVAVDRDGPNPVLAWLDGYAAGHADATRKALEVMLEVELPFEPGDMGDPPTLSIAPPIDDGPLDNWGGF